MFVHRGEAAVIMFAFATELFVGIHREILRSGDDGFVGGVEPDGGEKLIVLVRFDEGQDAVHDDAGVIAAHVVGDGGSVLHVGSTAFPGLAGLVAPALPALGRDGGIPSGNGRGGGEVGVESVLRRRRIVAARPGVLELDPADVPFPEVTGFVVLRLEHFRDGDFALSHARGVSGEDAIAEGVASGEAGAARRGTERRGGVEAVELDAIGGHSIEVRRFEIGVAIEADIAPALIIAHDHDDVGGSLREIEKKDSEAQPV